MIVVIVDVCADLLVLFGLGLVGRDVRHDVNIITNIVIVSGVAVGVGVGVGVFACHID